MLEQNTGFLVPAETKLAAGIGELLTCRSTGQRSSRSSKEAVRHSIEVSTFPVVTHDRLLRLCSSLLSQVKPLVSTALAQRRFDDHQYILKSIAGYYTKKLSAYFTSAEITQWASIGLWDGCNRYDGPEYEFIHYIRTRIKGQILDEVRREAHYIRRASEDNQPKFVQMDKIEGDHAIRQSTPPLAEYIDQQRKLRKVMRRMSRLTMREQKVINWYFFEGLKLKDIADKLGVSEPRASQLKATAIEKLAANTSTTGLIP